MSRIVVGVNGSEDADVALGWALQEARYRGEPLEMIYADPELTEIDSAVPSPPAVPPDEVEEGVQGGLERMVAAHDTTGVDVVTSLVPTGPTEALVTASLDSDLLVVGARGNGGLKERLLGSVSEHCVTHAACPVAVIPRGRSEGREGPSEPRIVIGVDGSAGSLLALRWGLSEAALRKWPALAVMAWSYLDQHHPGAGARFDPSYDRAEATAALSALVRQVGSKLDVDVEKATPCELAHVALIDSVFAQDLLVVGARGHGVLAGKMIGSVSLQCVHVSPCPIVVVRSRGPR